LKARCSTREIGSIGPVVQIGRGAGVNASDRFLVHFKVFLKLQQ
jgi:hypothetical protein